MKAKKRSLLFTVAVWGDAYVGNFLKLALPSFLAPGNIPACAAVLPIKFQIVTRPEDAPRIKAHPAIAALAVHAKVSIEPHLTPDCFTGNRYAVMSLANRFAITESLDTGAILSILSPDCIVADGGLSFGIRKILAGDKAVLVCGPKGVLETVGPLLAAAPFVNADGTSISIPSKDLVALQVTNPHPICQIVYWRRQPFSGFPSSVYWSAGKELTLARYFHLHPLFVDMSNADAEARRCSTQDSDLILLAGIKPDETFVATHSNEICVIELSSLSFDPMASVPIEVADKTKFVLDWAGPGRNACQIHRDQFRRHTFKLQGRETVDWAEVITDADRDMPDLFEGLANLDREEEERLRLADKERQMAKASAPVSHTFLSRLMLIPGKLQKYGFNWASKRAYEEIRDAYNKAAVIASKTARRIAYRLLNARLSKDTLFAIYDLEHYPISFDILWFTVWADIERRRRGIKNLQCVFVPCRDEATRKYPDGYDAVVDRESRAWRFQNICIPVVGLVADSGVTVSNGRTLAETLATIASSGIPHGNAPDLPTIYRQTTAGLMAQGSDWHGLSASMQGRRYIKEWLDKEIGNRKPVVITLRQYGVDPERNSALDEWAAFAESLDRKIYCPVIVPDTDNSLSPVPGFSKLPQFALASWNIGLRMALYEMAYINMFVNSGPGSMCILNRQCRYLFFKVVASTFLASEETLRRMGFERDTNPGFATPFQKWVWEPDDRAVLTREFDAMVSRIEATETDTTQAEAA